MRYTWIQMVALVSMATIVKLAKSTKLVFLLQGSSKLECIWIMIIVEASHVLLIAIAPGVSMDAFAGTIGPTRHNRSKVKRSKWKVHITVLYFLAHSPCRQRA